jgi:hypothetical protein
MQNTDGLGDSYPDIPSVGSTIAVIINIGEKEFIL